MRSCGVTSNFTRMQRDLRGTGLINGPGGNAARKGDENMYCTVKEIIREVLNTDVPDSECVLPWC